MLKYIAPGVVVVENGVVPPGYKLYTPPNHSDTVQHRTVSGKNWVEIEPSPQFARDCAYYLNPLHYGIIPANEEAVPAIKIKDRYLQSKLANPSDKVFNNAPFGYAVIDDLETKFLFADLDLHKKGSLLTHEACYQLGISKELYYKAMFQASKDKPSIHLLFRLDNEMLQLFREDQQLRPENHDRYFKSKMTSDNDSRIPENVELKLHPSFGNVRLKPGKRLLLKQRNEFPLITNYLKEIVLDIMNDNKTRTLRQIERANEAAKRTQNLSQSDLNEEQKRRCDMGRALLDGCIRDIKSCTGNRHDLINEKALKVASYSADGMIDLNLAYDKLLAAAFTTGYSKKECVTTIKTAFRDGVKPAKTRRFILKPRKQK